MCTCVSVAFWGRFIYVTRRRIEVQKALSWRYTGEIWKRHSSVHTTPRNSKKVSFSICVSGKLGQGDHEVNTAGVFKFLLFEERFQKVPFSWRTVTSVDGIPSRRYKSSFSIFSVVIFLLICFTVDISISRTVHDVRSLLSFLCESRLGCICIVLSSRASTYVLKACTQVEKNRKKRLLNINIK